MIITVGNVLLNVNTMPALLSERDDCRMSFGAFNCIEKYPVSPPNAWRFEGSGGDIVDGAILK